VYTFTDVYTAVIGRITAVYMGRRDGRYTAVYVPCTRPITAVRRAVCPGRVQGRTGPCTSVYVYIDRVYRYTAVCAPCTRPSAWRVKSRVHGPCARRYTAEYTFVYTAHKRAVHGHVTAVYIHIRVDVHVYTCTRPLHSRV